MHITRLRELYRTLTDTCLRCLGNLNDDDDINVDDDDNDTVL